MDHQDRSSQADEFVRLAETPTRSFLSEFWDFLIHNKKWWLTPIILVLLLMGLLVVLAGTPAGPFLYTLW
jgi:hypothetical protein